MGTWVSDAHLLLTHQKVFLQNQLCIVTSDPEAREGCELGADLFSSPVPAGVQALYMSQGCTWYQ